MIFKMSKMGFTLIEILLAGSIFMVVIIIGVASFSKSLGLQFKAASLSETNINARFPIETLAREIRMIDQDNLSVLDQNGNQVALGSTGRREGPRLELKVLGETESKIYYRDINNVLRVKKAGANDADGAALSSKDIKVKSLIFKAYKPITGQSKSQPHVTIEMTLELIGQKVEQKSEISLQTTVALRNFNKY